jgi:hypothetical protein
VGGVEISPLRSPPCGSQGNSSARERLQGKKEKSFRLLWDDFLKATEFASWEDLESRCRVWLDQTPDVANLRVHGTTRRVPNEAFIAEHELLIRLPEHRFPVHDDSVRDVDQDATLSIHGTRYSVPATLAGRSIAVRLFTDHFEILNPHGAIAFSRRYVEAVDHGKVIIDRTHYDSLPRRPRTAGSGQRLDEAFLRRFPDLAPLVEGIQRRMKTLAPVQIRALLRLADRYGLQAFTSAARRAQDFHRFDAIAVDRILQREHPLPEADLTPPLLGQCSAVLGDVEPPSLDGYEALDKAPTSATPQTKE